MNDEFHTGGQHLTEWASQSNPPTQKNKEDKLYKFLWLFFAYATIFLMIVKLITG